MYVLNMYIDNYSGSLLAGLDAERREVRAKRADGLSDDRVA